MRLYGLGSNSSQTGSTKTRARDTQGAKVVRVMEKNRDEIDALKAELAERDRFWSEQLSRLARGLAEQGIDMKDFLREQSA